MLHDDDTLRYLDNYNKNKQSNTYNTYQNYEKEKTLFFIQPIILIGTAIFIILALLYTPKQNPIIGKWKAINSTPFINQDIEFTEKRMYAFGMVGDVRYEEDGNKIIVFDKNGIFKEFGNIYIIKDKFTMENNTLGIKTIYKKVE